MVDRARAFGPFMTLRGLEVLRTVGGDGFIGGGSVFGPPDGQFWEAFWRGDYANCEEHARRTEELFPQLWLPGGWAGVHGAYQSELKAVMGMLGQPGGTTTTAPLAGHRRRGAGRDKKVLVGAGLLAE